MDRTKNLKVVTSRDGSARWWLEVTNFRSGKVFRGQGTGEDALAATRAALCRDALSEDRTEIFGLPDHSVTIELVEFL